MNTILTDDERPKLPDSLVDVSDGWYTAWQMEAYAAAPEAPAQLPRGECFTNGNICARCGHPEFIEAQPSVPAPWREAVKVAREALNAVDALILFQYTGTRKGMTVFNDVCVNARAALAQLDALEGGE